MIAHQSIHFAYALTSPNYALPIIAFRPAGPAIVATIIIIWLAVLLPIIIARVYLARRTRRLIITNARVGRGLIGLTRFPEPAADVLTSRVSQITSDTVPSTLANYNWPVINDTADIDRWTMSAAGRRVEGIAGANYARPLIPFSGSAYFQT